MFPLYPSLFWELIDKRNLTNLHFCPESLGVHFGIFIYRTWPSNLSFWILTSKYFITGVFRCGPASVNAVKNGEVYLPYDTGFIFAEVNGDRVYWDVDDDDGSMKAGYVDTNGIGKYISTKEPGTAARLDVTDGYKYQEGVCGSVKQM